MTEKQVRWVIDAPEELSDDDAALYAWRAMHRPGTTATFLEVKERGYEMPWHEVDVQQVLDERYVGRRILSRGLPMDEVIRGKATGKGREGTVVAVVPTCGHCDLWCLVPSWSAHAPERGPCVSLFEELDDEQRTLVLK